MRLTPFAKVFITLVILGVIGYAAWHYKGGAIRKWAGADKDKAAPEQVSSNDFDASLARMSSSISVSRIPLGAAAMGWVIKTAQSSVEIVQAHRDADHPLRDAGRLPLHRLDDMLMQVAETYDREVEVAIRKALALLQPVMIVAMAMVIGFIIIAILSAMLSVYDLPI